MVEFCADSLYDLLERMDEENRTPLSARSPLFRSLFKSPTIVNRLGFHHLQITINDKTYKLGIYRECLRGRSLSGIRNDNKQGGASYDIDRYGMRDRNGETTCKEGYVQIMNRNGVWHSIIDGYRSDKTDLYQQLQCLDKSLRDDEKTLRSCMENMQDEPMEYDDEEEIDIENLDIIDDDEKDYARDDMFWHGLWMTKNEDVLNRMVRFYDRRVVERDGLSNKLTGTPSNYKLYTQLTITRSSEQTIHHYSYEKKLMESFRVLIGCLLSGRDNSLPIKVNFLDISCDFMTIPLPRGIKFKVSNLKVDGNVGIAYDALKNNIHKSSFPLESLELQRCDFIEENIQHNIARAAKTIILPDASIRIKPNLIFECENEHISIKREENSMFSAAEYSRFLINFWRHGPSSHATLSLEVKDEKTAANVLKNVHNLAQSHSNGFASSASLLSLRMDNKQEDLQFSYMPANNGSYLLKAIIKPRIG